jgi:hypothetical protein
MSASEIREQIGRDDPDVAEPAIGRRYAPTRWLIRVTFSEIKPRHCERSEAIDLFVRRQRKLDCFAALAMTGMSDEPASTTAPWSA